MTKKRTNGWKPPIHVDLRHGEGWPKLAYKWTGWLTYREYNLIESHVRFGVENAYQLGKPMGITHDSVNRMYWTMVECGILDPKGDIENMIVTPMARILYDMTDQYILELDLGDEEAI